MTTSFSIALPGDAAKDVARQVTKTVTIRFFILPPPKGNGGHQIMALSKLPVRAGGEDVGRAAVGVVAGIGDELIIEGELGRGRQRVAVIGLENLLEAIVRQLTVADEDAEPAGVEESDMGRGDAIDNAGNADGVVGPAPRFA